MSLLIVTALLALSVVVLRLVPDDGVRGESEAEDWRELDEHEP